LRLRQRLWQRLRKLLQEALLCEEVELLCSGLRPAHLLCACLPPTHLLRSCVWQWLWQWQWLLQQGELLRSLQERWLLQSCLLEACLLLGCSDLCGPDLCCPCLQQLQQLLQEAQPVRPPVLLLPPQELLPV